MAHKNRSNWSPYKERRAKALENKTRREKENGATAPKNKIPGNKASMHSSSPVHHPPGSRHRRPEETFNFHEADDRIYSILRNHGFGDYPHDKRQKLTRFYHLLMENQKHENFTRLLSLRDIAIKHFIDSLIITRLTDLDFPLLDMGTGPGFPGIPLKIHFPEKRIILAEGVQRRVNFLKKVREELALPNLDIIGRNINEQFLYPVQGVITRAVEDSRNTLGNVLYCLQTGGRVFLMKGPNVDPEIEPALETWGEYFHLEKNIPYELPQTPHQRRLLVFRKIKPAPLRDLDADLDADFARNAADPNQDQDEGDDE